MAPTVLATSPSWNNHHHNSQLMHAGGNTASHYNDNNTIGNGHSHLLKSPKRKSGHPHRSIPFKSLSKDEKVKMGIINLDVYTLFKTNPKKLLLTTTGTDFHHGMVHKHSYRSHPERGITGTAIAAAGGSYAGSSALSAYYDDRYSTHGGSDRYNRGTPGSTSPLTSHQGTPAPSSSPRLTERTHSYSGTASTNARGKRRGRPPSSVSKTSASLGRENIQRRSSPPAIYNPLPLDASGKPIITWPKSYPLQLDPNSEGYELLTTDEIQTCSILRLYPMQYLKVKETLLAHREVKGFFRKREAQKLCRIDVNKTGKLYDWFIALGWLSGNPEDKF